MVALIPTTREHLSLAYALHEPGLRDFLFPGPLPTRAETERWFEGLQDCATVSADGIPIGLVWYVGHDGVSCYVTVGLTQTSKGYGTAIAKQVIDRGFRRNPINRLATTAVTSNAPAVELASSLGYCEGLLREAFVDASGKYHDVEIYSLLRSEWKE